eukprot:5324753-Pleurochrysis_carterae.AAC.1
MKPLRSRGKYSNPTRRSNAHTERLLRLRAPLGDDPSVRATVWCMHNASGCACSRRSVRTPCTGFDTCNRLLGQAWLAMDEDDGMNRQQGISFDSSRVDGSAPGSGAHAGHTNGSMDTHHMPPTVRHPAAVG